MAQATATKAKTNGKTGNGKTGNGKTGNGKTESLMHFAQRVGASTRQTLQDSQPYHEAYLKIAKDKEAVKGMRDEWYIGSVAGVLGVTLEVAETICKYERLGAKPKKGVKARDKDQQRAYDRARFLFKFHVTREVATSKSGVKAAKIELTEEDAKQCLAAVKAAGFADVTVENVEATIAYLHAFAKTLK